MTKTKTVRTQRRQNTQSSQPMSPVAPKRSPATLPKKSGGKLITPGSDAHPTVIGKQIGSANPTAKK